MVVDGHVALLEYFAVYVSCCVLMLFQSFCRVKQYFYGPSGNLFPHSFDVPFSEVKDRIYKIGRPTSFVS
jgi:hypothetical protein